MSRFKRIKRPPMTMDKSMTVPMTWCESWTWSELQTRLSPTPREPQQMAIVHTYFVRTRKGVKQSPRRSTLSVFVYSGNADVCRFPKYLFSTTTNAKEAPWYHATRNCVYVVTSPQYGAALSTNQQPTKQTNIARTP